MSGKKEVEIKNKCGTVDDALAQFNVFGRYHLTTLLFLFIAYCSNSAYVTNYVFAVEKVDYRCKSVNNPCAIQPHQRVLIEDIRCFEHVYVKNDTSCTDFANTSLVPCHEWVYDDPNSFMAEFELGCQEWKRTFVGSAHSFGLMIGLLIVGPMSDRFGRKTAIIMTGVFGGVFGLLRSFVTSYWLYVALEVLEASLGDICSPVFMLALEIISAKDRVLFMTLSHYGHQFGGIVLASLAFSFPYWRHFLRVLYAPALLFIFYIFAIDESPRWLLIKNKREEAIAIFQKASKLNKFPKEKSMDDITFSDDKHNEEKFLTVLKTAFNSKELLRRVLVAFVWWASSLFCHYGVMINSVFLAGNKYLNFMLLSVVDIPAVTIMGFILEKFNRKMPLFMSFLAAAVFFFIQAFMPHNLPWLSLIMYLAGRFFVTIYLGIVYIYTSELFPTETRNTLHAMCSSVGRLGSIIAPQVPLLTVYWRGLPSLIFSGVSLMAALLTLTIPDVKNVALPDTLQQAEDFGIKTDTKV